MGRPAKSKKTAESKPETAENVNGQETTLKKQKLSKKVEPTAEIEEPMTNGVEKVKSNGKATKAAKNSKESKDESKNIESNEKAAKNAENGIKSTENGTEQEKGKKRATKKKAEDIPEIETSKKRNKKDAEKKEDDKKDETVKKRGRKEPAKSTEPKSEPVNKKSKKNEVEPAKEEKKKPPRGKKVADESPKAVDEATTTVTDEKSAAKKGKAAKKKVEKVEEQKPEAAPKPAKGRAAKKAENGSAPKPEEEEAAEKPKKGRAAKKDNKESENVETTSPKVDAKEAVTKKNEKSAGGKKLMNSIESDFSIDFDISSKYTLKISMWNTSGLRSCVEKGCVDYFKHENPDIICLNEMKCGTEKDIPEAIKLEGYHAYWNIAKGSPGVGILTKQMPIDVFYDMPGEFSDEKRLLTAEFKNFYLVCCYVVNAGRGLKTLDKRLKWNEVFDDYIRELDKKKPVIIAGDMNVAHTEIDLANPKTNQKNAGFTKEEREGFSQLLSYGFKDTFRHFYPEQKGAYTFWSYMGNARSKNVGWRLDYFIASERFMDKVKDSAIRSTIKGSDHCPIVLFVDL